MVPVPFAKAQSSHSVINELSVALVPVQPKAKITDQPLISLNRLSHTTTLCVK